MSKRILGYYGSRPVFMKDDEQMWCSKMLQMFQAVKLVTNNNNNGGGFMDLSKVTSSLKNIVKHSATLLFGILIGVIIMLVVNKNAQTDFGRSDISLADVQVAWVPESEQIVFLDRKTNVVTKLSKDVVFAIFSLKMASMQQEFTLVTKQPTGNTVKKQPTQSQAATTNPITPK